MIYKNCENLQDLVTNLFELSKLQSDQVMLNKEPFSIGELVHDVANKYRILSQKKGVNINTIVSKDIPVVEADVLLIDRVLQNLIDNAIRFCKEGDTINIELKSQATGEVNITIADTGAGIQQDHLPHIFDRYFRKDERGGSSGLGLAIVKRIIDLHESSIEVKSTAGQGNQLPVQPARGPYRLKGLLNITQILLCACRDQFPEEVPSSDPRASDLLRFIYFGIHLLGIEHVEVFVGSSFVIGRKGHIYHGKGRFGG